ncbi:SIS domain-containing protein [Flavobacterium sp. MC2016-06]|jgi:RpiR family glv operon transcriptional regulator|uniref:MurR/RpiR family transcriptional regulator n=1 Tax=Flavobacterium sp. MC2016-06 TaxID=2676308 RepID=UPI0012BAB03C|nr:SIS domain-containing protein [Flavobacterium sp. MC2016-06]MBU3861762.1 SIS domain-containing protein [Flavobacterium sp. MC2016-06]
MYIVNKDLLNSLEKNIYSALLQEIKQNHTLSITDAGAICGCSPSKISKFIQKLGFKNYKEYLGFISGKAFSVIPNENERLNKFLEDFNPEIINQFAAHICKFEKIILFGYGPSFIAGQYFEYKLRNLLEIPIWAVAHETSINDLLSKNSLVIIFSVTGQFKPFKELYENIVSKNSKAAFILEEGRTDFLEAYDYTITLSNYLQNTELLPHEKTRTTFFTFIEAVIKQLEKSSVEKHPKKR